MKKTYRVSVAIVAGISLLGVTNPASSLGFGRPTSRAILGEALSVTIPVRLEAGEEIANDCVAADIYFGDEKLSEANVVTTLSPGGPSERVVRVSTTSLVNEPVVTMYLAVGCKARITRKFVAFADPPGMVSAPTSGGSPLSAPGLPVEPASALSTAALGSVEGGGAAASTNASGRGGTSAVNKRRARERSRADGGAETSSRTARSGEGAQSAAAASPSSRNNKSPSSRPADALSSKLDARIAAPVATSRLELDPADLDALVTPELMMSSVLSGSMADVDKPETRERRAAAAALWAAMNASPEQLAQDRLRVQELEQRLARLQQDSAGATQKVAAMEARVHAAENKRLNHPLVWALAGLCLLLLGAVAWLFSRQRRQQEAQASWWQGEPNQDAPDTAPALGEPMMARTSAEFMPVRSADTDSPPPAVAPAAAVKTNTSDVPQGAIPFAAASSTTTTRPVSLKSEAQDAAREITVEELIDLEQQAEFFVVLGQEDAAVELLESHVQTTAGASPLPYLKLLEIYQRLGKRDDYERIRSAFNSRFNAYAPAWESDLQQGHSLEDYPGVVDRLQSLWTMPAKTMELLQVSLTRADGSEETFDLPAYRELLFLYAVARDLEERESKDRAPVDLLLPVQDAEQDVDGGRDPSLQPLMATRPIKALPQASPSLSLDLSLDDPVPSGSGAYVDDAQSNADDIPTTPSSDNGIDFEPMDLTPPKQR